MMAKKLIVWYREISMKSISLVGGKNASLGEMMRHLGKQINIPDGFATTDFFYWQFLKKSNLKSQIVKILKGLERKNIRNLKERGAKIRDLILKTEFPKELEKEVIRAYRKLCQKYKTKNLDVAVRSSATAEDLPNASFAGQQESFLNIRGEKELLLAVKKCLASLFTDRAISYREDMGFDHLKVALSVGVQKMVRSDLACSGVMFSCDTETGFPDVVLINAGYGLGENIVKGKINPDQYYVFEKTLKNGFQPIIEKKMGTKEWRLIYNHQGGTKNVAVLKKEQKKFVLTDEEILTLARWSCLIEKHYGRPMDIEWAKDGKDKKLYILQARPETVVSRRKVDYLEEYVLEKLKIKNQKCKPILEGLAVGSKIGQGKVRVIRNIKELVNFKKGEVLVARVTNPDFEPVMKIASAIITDSGGRTSHAAIVSREIGVPCVVGTGKASKILKNGQEVTVSCAEGERGFIYEGLLPFKIRKINLAKLKRPKIKIMMNLGEPDQAFSLSFLPNDGVGLAREEFIIANQIKIHPIALINYKQQPPKIKKQIDQLTFGYQDKKQYFIDKLAEGIGKICAAFYPKEVIVRFSDFKTNEYANLIGGAQYEPKEANPMIGWRGASRYYDEKFKEAFGLECLAIKKVREVFGLDNVVVMIPFCRTVEEGKKVLKIIDSFSLRKKLKGLKPLKVYVMAEIPSNIIFAEEFSKIFDGFSIGSNDLTQLTLGLDRDSDLVSHLFDERNEAIKKLIRHLIKTAHRYGRKVGICGQAPSDFPDFAKFLVKEGIDSISLNPDTILKTTLEISKIK
ncbi:MAG: phosphoenolpyruvate synthase [Patescibacteria group bacterium]|nr:phosphoenolpyruvate synthase [Patescibacteria group bacterium]